VDTITGRLSLLLGAIFTGVLLALYGQTYQTGADPWQLFFNWSLLILPWVVISRFPVLWVLWLSLLNLSVILYYQALGSVPGIVFTSEEGLFWPLFILNTLALILWELAAGRLHWLEERWAVRLIAVGGGVSVSLLAMHSILDSDDNGAAGAVTWLLWVAVMIYVYLKRHPDLFMLAGICLSGIVVVTTFLGRHLLDDANAAGFLLLSMLVIAMGSGAAFWLRKVHQAWQR
jgi:uncharacterized membrane protein